MRRHDQLLVRRWRRFADTVRRTAIAGLAISITLGGAAVPAQAAGKGRDERRPATQKAKSVNLGSVALRPLPAKKKSGTAPKAIWPEAGAVEVTPAPLESAGANAFASSAPTVVGGLPIRVTAAEPAATRLAAGATPAKVRVEVLPPAAAEAADSDGLALRVTRTDGGTAAGKVRLDIDYSAFSDAIGGDWSSRLQFATVPVCAVADQADGQECEQGDFVATDNDPEAQRLSAVVDAQPVAADQTGSGRFAHATLRGQALAAGSDQLLAAKAGAQGPAGNFAATSLSPAGAWQAGGSSGAFTWQYPVRVPPAIAGPAPDLSLAYTSATVDGRTAATSSQPSWIGEGFEFNGAGFIERSYKTCADDGEGKDKDGQIKDFKKAKFDYCWPGVDDQLNMSFGGHSGEMVKISDNVWRLKNDDGTTITRETNGSNGDDNHEYFILTATDGTRYYFGRGKRFADDTEANPSAWTVPVYGNNKDEPCYDKGKEFKDRRCTQAWRWNLDYVTDLHGNSMTFFWQKETNRYATNHTDKSVVTYDRGGYLTRIEYGTRAGTEKPNTAPSKVTFGVGERCRKPLPKDPKANVAEFPVDETCKAADLKKGTTERWPDVPFDQICVKNADPKKDACKDQWSPTFFTRARLSSITTSVLDGGTYRNVDTWKLGQSLPDPGDGSSGGLVLDSITHTGTAGEDGEGDDKLPPTVFNYSYLSNRQDAKGDGALPYLRPRMESIFTESGGVISVDYRTHNCGADLKPESNTTLCMPSLWMRPDSKDAAKKCKDKATTWYCLDWFHKYVVDKVVENARSGLEQDQKVTSYVYDGPVGWAKDDSELTKSFMKTWNQFRGFGKVSTITGGNEQKDKLKTTATYLRGLGGTVTASDGTKVGDDARAQGFLLEQQTFNGSQEVSASVYTPWIAKSPGQGADKTDVAKLMQPGTTRTRTWLHDDVYRQTGSQHWYNDDGLLIRSEDHGDIGTDGKNDGRDADDDSCTTYEYAPNRIDNVMTLLKRSYTVNGPCSNGYRVDKLVSEVRTGYDVINKDENRPNGDVAWSEKLSTITDGKPTFTRTESTYDAYGRVASESQVLTEAGKTRRITSTTSYTHQANGGPVATMTTKDPAGNTSTSAIDPAWGEPRTITDANGQVTTLRHDGLGRLVKVWLPGHSTSRAPDTEYRYQVRNDAATTVETRKLGPSGEPTSSFELYDPLLRPWQTQTPAAGDQPGRLITNKVYDSRGLAVRQSGPFYNSANPDDKPVDATDVQSTPNHTITTYDAAGRVTSSTLRVPGQPDRTSTTSYHGDHTVVVPPEGEMPTATYTNAKGQTTELWEYRSREVTGDRKDADITTYGYDQADRMNRVVDAAGHTWTFSYDAAGRKISATDPDTGETTTKYNDLGQIASTTDNRKRTLEYSYDLLGRPKTVTEGGKQLLGWEYDKASNGKGRAYSSTRYVDGAAYTSTVNAYDQAGRPLSTSVTIPKEEGKLADTYTTTATYAYNGAPATVTLPAAGGMPAETISTSYNLDGTPHYMQGLKGLVSETVYSPFGEILQYGMGVDSASKYTWTTNEYEEGTRRLIKSSVDREVTDTTDSSVSYAYDAVGNVLKIAEKSNDSALDTQCFQYDYQRRMHEAWAQDQAECAAKPSTEVLGGPAPYWQTFDFDAAGNRTRKTDHRITAEGTDAVQDYHVRGLKQAVAHGVEQTDTTMFDKDGKQVGEATKNTFDYDAAGNTTRRVIGKDVDQKLDWDAEGHVAKITAKDGNVTTFVYDASGNRLLRRDQSTQSTTLYLGGQELRLDTHESQPDKQNVTATRYYTFGGRTVAVRTATGLSWLAGGQNGTSELAIDAVTSAVTRQRTKPYGEVRGPNTPLPGERGFVGGTNDVSTGLVHLGAREYDPTSGRFISPDPVMDFNDPQQLNAYAYGRGNPLAFADPSGQWWGSDWNWNAIGHTALDVVGMIPGPVGMVANGVNAGWYALQGDYTNAAMSAAGILLPGAGKLLGKGVQALKGGLKAGEAAAEVTADVAKAADKVEDTAKAAEKMTPPSTPKPKPAPKPEPPASPKSGSAGGSAAKAESGAAKAEGAGAKSGKSAGTRDADLVDAVEGKASAITKKGGPEYQSINQRGPVLSGVKDRLTGEIRMAQNGGGLPENLHPSLAENIKNGMNPYLGGSGVHGEVHALNDLLGSRAAAGLSTKIDTSFVFYSVRLRGAAQGAQILRCTICQAVTRGAGEL